MKNLLTIPFSGYARYGILLLNLMAVFTLSSCSSSSDSSTPFSPVNSLEGKVIVLGAQEDVSGNLDIYVHGTDLAGAVLTVADLKTATVKVGDSSYTNDHANLTIAEVAETTDNFLSLSIVIDWSNSTNGELALVSGIFTQMLDNLPLVYEAQVITFSDEHEVKLAWSEDPVAIKAAAAAAHSDRNMTALYDTMQVALNGDIDTEGLVGKCRPAHVQVVFTDGLDNLSSIDPATIETAVNNDRTVSIMLGTSDADTAVLHTLAGDHGAVVQVVDPTSLGDEVEQWVASLKNIVKINVGSAIYSTNDTVSITMGSQTISVFPNSRTPCPAVL